MENSLSLSLKDNPELQEIVSDKNAGDRVTFEITILIKEKDADRLSGTVEEVKECPAPEEEPADTPAVRVAKRAPKGEAEGDE